MAKRISEIYVKRKKNEGIGDFAVGLGRLLTLNGLEHHESSNFAGGYYYAYRIQGIKITIAFSDMEEFDEYDWWVYLDPDWLGDGPEKDLSIFIKEIADLLKKESYTISVT